MDAIARSLHLGGRSSDFYAHLHIVDLYNVPLVEGECKIKWRFRGAVHLNAVERSQIIDRAKEGTVGYLLQRASTTFNSRLGTGNLKKGSLDSDTDGLEDGLHPDAEGAEGAADSGGEGHHPGRSGKLASLGKALLHPNRHARKQQHQQETQRRRRRESSSNSAYPKDTSPPQSAHKNRPNLEHDYLNESTASQKTPRQSQIGTFQPLSPTGTIVFPPQRSLTSTLSRSQTGMTFSYSRNPYEDTPDSPSSPSTSSRQPFEPVTESKGTTRYRQLVSNACSFDQHVVCAVGIPLEKNSQHLQPCPVRLAVKHKVRVTPSANQSSATNGALENGTSRSRKTSTHNSPSSSTASLVSTSTSTKELHEEIPLGEITLDLSEFVEAGRSSKRSERWISRRYLLQNGKTNALLRVAVKMEWISGEASYTPSVCIPPDPLWYTAEGIDIAGLLMLTDRR